MELSYGCHDMVNGLRASFDVREDTFFFFFDGASCFLGLMGISFGVLILQDLLFLFLSRVSCLEGIMDVYFFCSFVHLSCGRVVPPFDNKIAFQDGI